MKEPAEELTCRAKRLLCWYPKDWRARYGDEFAELLVAEIRERPRSLRRSADVAWSGLTARLTDAGLAGQVIERGDQVRASLASLGCALGVFLAFGVALWSQLTIGWQWSEPATSATYAAMILMSGIMLLFCVLAVFSALPIAFCVIESIARGRWQRLVRPSLLWAHLGALASFPTLELVWMALSPLAMVCLVVGAAKTVRRVDLPPRTLRYEAFLARVSVCGMSAFLVGSCVWVIDRGPGPKNLFHTGAIDIAALVMMGAAVAVGYRAAQRARHGGLVLSWR